MPIQNTANCVLIRYDGGHTYVDRADGHSRKEVYLELKGVKDLDHARQIGAEFLSLMREQRSTTAIQGTALDITQLPGAAFHLGDFLGDLPIIAMAATSDLQGNVKVVPQLGDPVALQVEAMNRRIQRIGAGITSEWAAPTINVQDEGSGTDTTPPAFSQSGQIVTQLSPPWAVPRPWWCSWLEADLEIAGSTSSRFRLYQTTPAGVTSIVGTLTIAAGDTKAVLPVPNPADPPTATPRGIGYPAKSKLVMACDIAGTGAQNLTLTPRGTMV